MAQIGINVSTRHGSTISVSQMISDECLVFDTKVLLKASYEGAEPHVYCSDTVYLHGDPEALRILLESCLAALEARTRKEAA